MRDRSQPQRTLQLPGSPLGTVEGWSVHAQGWVPSVLVSPLHSSTLQNPLGGLTKSAPDPPCLESHPSELLGMPAVDMERESLGELNPRGRLSGVESVFSEFGQGQSIL